MKNTLQSLYRSCFGERLEEIAEIRAHASERRIFRLRGSRHSAVGVSNSNLRENRAFLEFTKHFLARKLPVPFLFASDLSAGIYIIEDLGDESFLDILEKRRDPSGVFDAEVESLLFSIIRTLPRFQVEGAEGPHLDYCFQSRVFDHSSAIRDARYFEKAFLERVHLQYDSDKFARDAERLAEFMEGAEHSYFMYRDFQSRNVMICDAKPYFIDYQAGRLGPLQYDVVSFLYQSKARLSHEIRERAVREYLKAIQELAPVNEDRFTYHFDAFVLIRLMQVLATYGQQGLGAGKV